MKTSWLMALCVSLAMALAPSLSDAKRLGGGKSSGMQRDMPARTAPNSTPATPAAPTQSAAAAPATAGAGAAAAAPKRSWMGPIAGLAAGLGIAALMSHLGMGEAFGNFLMLALLAVAAVFLVRFVMRRMSGGSAQPANAMAGGSGARSGAQVAWPPAGASSAPAMETRTAAGSLPAGPELATTTATPLPAAARAFVPASFDSEGFGRIAKTIFVRLQTANDSGDLDDIRRFTTPEMFAELRMDLQDRGVSTQQTDVLRVDAEVLDVADDGQRQIVSVRFHGQVREDAGAVPSDFDEVWHLVKPNDDSRNWAIAGIEQQAPTQH